VRIRLLGTGTPTPSLKRMSSGYLVETGSRKILFDFGPGAYHRLLEAASSRRRSRMFSSRICTTTIVSTTSGS
jgi:ribonuclease BN (tRNA processing enzyme)